LAGLHTADKHADKPALLYAEWSGPQTGFCSRPETHTLADAGVCRLRIFSVHLEPSSERTLRARLRTHSYLSKPGSYHLGWMLHTADLGAFADGDKACIRGSISTCLKLVFHPALITVHSQSCIC